MPSHTRVLLWSALAVLLAGECLGAPVVLAEQGTARAVIVAESPRPIPILSMSDGIIDPALILGLNAKAEDDGYLVSFITNENTQGSEIVLIDCQRFDEGPICRIELPHKLCSGTHSCWASGADLRDGLLARQS